MEMSAMERMSVKVKDKAENSDSIFDRVLHSVGDDGKFQQRYNLIFNIGLCIAVTMVYINIVLAMTIPEHWCSIPGRDEANVSIEEWKNLSLPREIGSSGMNSFSSCKMYNRSYYEEDKPDEINNADLVNCQYGYEYNTDWFTRTIPSTQDWVCDKELRVSNVFGIAKVGEVVGGLIFGYLGDVIGRRPVFMLSLGIAVVSRLVSIMVTEYYIVFLIASILASSPSTTAAQSCQVILMEVSPMEDRAYIAQYQNIGWTIGIASLPLVYWWFKDWTYYMLFTTAPLLLYIPLAFFLIESPRWLLSRGRIGDCIRQLKKISKVNGTKLTPDISLMLHNVSTKPEKTYGICSLFSNWRLAKNSMLLMVSWIATILSYNTIMLSVTSLSGNPFLNFFLQSIAELPSYMMGKFLCEKAGRRLTCGMAYLIGVCSVASTILIIDNPDLGWLQVTLSVIAKLSVSMSYFVTSLQSLEIYPTCIRQTGFTFGLLSGNTFSILGPYIVYLGATYDVRLPYFIITLLCIAGIGAQILLPETLNEKLPETLQEAKTFGVDQEYWSIPHKKNDTYILANVKYIDKSHHDNSDTDN